MPTLYITHADCLGHAPFEGHPERPARLEAIWKKLEDAKFDALQREDAIVAAPEAAALAHPETYVERIADLAPAEGIVGIDADTAMSPGSWRAALLAVGAAKRSVDAVMSGEATNAFCAIRPPGHHAEHDRAMGFCLFNNAAIAAAYARAEYGAERLAIIDFDVHHGNGTQDIFWNDRNVFYGSTHQMPLYPGSGAIRETGAGNIFNAPLRPGSGSDYFRMAMEERILPALENFAPDLIVISAGFAAHTRDPLADIHLQDEDFGWITGRLMDIADRRCEGRIVSLLEGGYDLQGLAGGVAAHVGQLMQA